MAVAGSFDPAGLMECDPEVFYEMVRLLSGAPDAGDADPKTVAFHDRLAEMRARRGR